MQGVRILSAGLIFLGNAVMTSAPLSAEQSCLTHICTDLVLDKETLVSWHRAKAAGGPTYAGTPAWHQYLQTIEAEAGRLGMVDIRHNDFSYDRWQTSDWPDRSGWSLDVAGKPVPVGHYGPNSGDTDPAGIEAEIVLVTDWDQQDLRGKIALVPVKSSGLLTHVPGWLFAGEAPAYPVGHRITPDENVYQSTVSQLFSANLDGRLHLPGPALLKRIKESGAVGAVILFDMADDRVEGLYGFPVPDLYDVPTLYLGRESGRDVLDHLTAAADKRPVMAHLRLEAKIVKASAYQFAAFLPGRRFGQDDDEIIMMISHTDGPSISQENGPFGLLGIVHYFSHIRRQDRDKTLMLFLDARHYVPGREASHPDLDIEKVLGPGGPLAPAKGRIVASVHLEHLGQIEYREADGRMVPTGRPEAGSIYVTGYQPIIDIAHEALADNRPPNQSLRSTDLKGLNCTDQGIWFGLGHWPRRIGVEAVAATMSFMGGYWTEATNDLNAIDFDLFTRQMNSMTQITGHFMTADIEDLLTEKAIQPGCPS